MGKRKKYCFIDKRDKASLAQLVDTLNHPPQAETEQEYKERLKLWALLKQIAEADEIVINEQDYEPPNGIVTTY